jgi:hypothetical protein
LKTGYGLKPIRKPANKKKKKNNKLFSSFFGKISKKVFSFAGESQTPVKTLMKIR